MKIGTEIFNSFAEYEAAYIKKWEALHPTLSPDLNWIRKDWEYRISNQ